jgi:hypothetical protein
MFLTSEQDTPLAVLFQHDALALSQQSAILSIYWIQTVHVHSVNVPSPVVPSTATGNSDQTPRSDPGWSWNPDKDRNNHRLSEAQCSSAFPLLYKEIDRAATFWGAREGQTKILQENIDLDWSWDGGLRCMIYDQNLYIIHSRGLNHFGHWKERHRATLDNIHRAIMTSPEPIPNIEFSIKINDDVNLTDQNPNATLWAFSRNIHDPVHEQLWIIPDFNFWAYPRVAGSFSEYQRRAVEVGNDFDGKIPKLVWRGTLEFNSEVRAPLLEQSKGQSWSDVVKVDADSGEDIRMSAEDHCRYKFAVHTEGTTWSGRLKYLLSCNSVVFIHPLKYYTHLYHLLTPRGIQQNYVPVQLDWTDLPAKMEEFLHDQTTARRVAQNAASTFRDRYATAAAQTCYFRRLFHTWSTVSFQPEPYKVTKLKDGSEVRRTRGMTYEEYM